MHLLETRMETFPWFVHKFIHYKLDTNLSPSSLLEYSRDFESFFSWIIQIKSPDNLNYITQMDIGQLEVLTAENIQEFEEYLLINSMKERTILRKIQSLRSLFNYLHDVAENDAGEPLLSKNIFRKITKRRTGSPIETARDIQNKVLASNESDDFIDYLRSRYRTENGSNLQAIWNYDINGVRDICIINFMLKTGLLVSDLINLNVSDISIHDQQININRQWSGIRSNHSVFFSLSTKTDLLNYLKIRDTTYRPNHNEAALFLSLPNGQKIGKRITKRGIQSMVIKYATKFGKPGLTTRQLRHSFGLEHQRQSNYVRTKQQLAYRSTEATEKYQFLTDFVD